MLEVKTGGKILLFIFGLLLSVSVIVAQAAFKLERTTRSYTYMSKQLERILAPLSDPGIRAEAANGAFGFLRGALSLDVSPRLEPYIQGAVSAGFDADWFLRTGKRMLFNSQRFQSGRESKLSLPVSIDSFKIMLMDIVRPEFETSEYLEIDREVSRMSSSIDLVTLMDENDLARIVNRLKTYRHALVILAYVLPGVLFVLCFSTRRIGSGLAAAGCGLLAGGGLVVVASVSLPGLAFQAVSSAIGGALPPFLGWVADGAGKLAGDMVYDLLPAALVITGFGLALAAAGVFFIVVKKNPRGH